MALNNNLPYRRSIRLAEYDYRQAGAYFITVCTHHREPLFGEIIGGQMQLNAAGRVVQSAWDAIPTHFPGVAMGEYVVMPDHFHGILLIPERRGTACRARDDSPLARDDDMRMAGTACRAPTGMPEFGKPIAGSIATIIRSFKSVSTKQINSLRSSPGMPLWQRNYWERIIRDEREQQAIERYILDNPRRRQKM